MKLRPRLALAALAFTLPATLGLLWFDAVAQHRAASDILTDIVRHAPLDRARCDAFPEASGAFTPPSFEPPPRVDRGMPPPPEAPHPAPPRFGKQPIPATFYVYDASFRSRDPRAPSIAPSLAAAIRDHESAVDPFGFVRPDVDVLVRTPWDDGPCAYVLAHGTVGGWGAILPETHYWLLPALLMLFAVLFAVGPVIGRIRALTLAVQRSASTAYQSPIAIAAGDEIGDLARAFDAAAREIRSQLAAKEKREAALREFVSNTAHDVMIPLTVLQGHLVTLRERAAAGETADSGVIVSAMNEAHYLGSLMHNLAVAARLEVAEAKLVRSDVDLNALVLRVVARHQTIANERQITLENAVPGDPVLVSADVTLLEQAVSNVTDNALRYNRSGGHVAIIVERLAGDRFRLRVLDDGPGIALEDISKLRQRGARGDDARTRAPSGQGLGLHIAFSAAELHGYSLTFAKSEYDGLVVTLEGDATSPAKA